MSLPNSCKTWPDDFMGYKKQKKFTMQFHPTVCSFPAQLIQFHRARPNNFIEPFYWFRF